MSCRYGSSQSTSWTFRLSEQTPPQKPKPLPRIELFRHKKGNDSSWLFLRNFRELGAYYVPEFPNPRPAERSFHHGYRETNSIPRLNHHSRLALSQRSRRHRLALQRIRL